ncbi:hypothetical protein D3C81_1307000 [compost metagenome]
MNQERAVFVTQPVTALAVRSDTFGIQPAPVALQGFQRIAQRHFVGGTNQARWQRQPADRPLLVMQRA